MMMKKTNKHFYALFLLPFFMLTACGQSSSNNQVNSKSNGIVVLELFTSQGCSSCPPADKVLANYVLKNNPKIIPLAFHVDYWNRLGWKDPFSKTEYSNRQREYSQNFNADNVYTPQLIINGKHEIVGSNESGIERLVDQELVGKNNSTITITKAILSENQLVIDYKTDAIGDNHVVNFALVKKKEVTNIKRGENSGLQQTSYNIVYDFKEQTLNANSKNEVSLDFNNNWKPADFFVVAYLQINQNGAIETACKAEIK